VRRTIRAAGFAYVGEIQRLRKETLETKRRYQVKSAELKAERRAHEETRTMLRAAQLQRESGWVISFNSRLVTVGGTSCVAPAVAGFLALVNLRYTSGFNAALYTIWRDVNTRPLVFKDIVAAKKGSEDPKTPTAATAAGTYDFSTGLGAFNGAQLYQSLKELLVKEPTMVQNRDGFSFAPRAAGPPRRPSLTATTVTGYKRTPEQQAAFNRARGWRLLFV
jgi:hypothetical protein